MGQQVNEMTASFVFSSETISKYLSHAGSSYYLQGYQRMPVIQSYVRMIKDKYLVNYFLVILIHENICPKLQ